LLLPLQKKHVFALAKEGVSNEACALQWQQQARDTGI